MSSIETTPQETVVPTFLNTAPSSESEEVSSVLKELHISSKSRKNLRLLNEIFEELESIETRQTGG